MAISRRTIQQTKIEVSPIHQPPPIEFYFYVGERYYRRMQPIPYQYKNNYIKKVKEILESIN